MTLAVLVMLQDVLLKLGRGATRKAMGPLHVVGMVLSRSMDMTPNPRF